LTTARLDHLVHIPPERDVAVVERELAREDQHRHVTLMLFGDL